MSFRIVHFDGTKEALLGAVKEHADRLKAGEDKDYYGDDQWEAGVDSVIQNDFSDEEMAAIVLYTEINNSFHVISEDWKINAYEDLAKKAGGKLRDVLLMFENGRNFSTGAAGFGDEVTCGYLTPDEVKELLVLLQNYTPDTDPEYEKEFVDGLIKVFETLANKNSGDLFVMS